MLSCPELECNPPLENTIPIDYCCPPNPCNINLDDILCGLRNLLPPGKAWEDCCGDGNRAKFLEIIAIELHKWVSESLCCISKEYDPCVSEKMIDCWAELYGIPKDCITLDDLSEETQENLKRAFLCVHERLQFGQVPNACFLKEIASILGIEINIHAPGIVGKSTLCCFLTAPSESLRKDCANQCPPSSSPTSCHKIAPSIFIEIVEEEDPIQVECNITNTPFCRYPSREIIKCVFDSFIPSHVYWCFI